MKNQSFGRIRVRLVSSRSSLLTIDATVRCTAGSLRDYRAQRGNGDKRDDPKKVFPAAGFHGLDIKSSDALDWSNKWPDKEGRYWWKLKCEDGREINDFYWKKDEVRGYPNKADKYRYWFTVHHAPSGTKIEGFSARSDREEEYPDKDKKYWSYIQYDECGPIKVWMEEKDKNYVARLQRKKGQEPSNAAAQEYAAEEKQRQEQLAAKKFHLAEMKEQEDKKIREESEKRAAEIKRLEDARIAAEKAQTIVAAEKKALAEERLQAEQEKRQLEEQRRKHEEEKMLSPSSMISSVQLSSSSSSSGLSSSTNPFSQLNFYIPYKDITLGERLGSGGFGEVFEGDRHGEKVAVKKLLLHRMSEKALDEFKQEVAIMASLHFDYIVTFKGVCVEPYCMVMEYMPGGSLYGVLHSQIMLPWQTRHRIAWDMAKGLAFLHRQEPMIIYRDLKSHNVLLTADYQCAKLTDFGIARIREECATVTTEEFCGSYQWMAPECFENKYSIRSDMYSYGMVLWELVSRKTPYQGTPILAVCYKITTKNEREEIPNEMTKLSPERPTAKTPQSIKDFIGLCWLQETARRPTAQQAVKAFEQDIERELAPEYAGHGDLDSGFVDNFNSSSSSSFSSRQFADGRLMPKAEGKEPQSPSRPAP